MKKMKKEIKNEKLIKNMLLSLILIILDNKLNTFKKFDPIYKHRIHDRKTLHSTQGSHVYYQNLMEYF